jgi:hypothetical protein
MGAFADRFKIGELAKALANSKHGFAVNAQPGSNFSLVGHGDSLPSLQFNINTKTTPTCLKISLRPGFFKGL